MGRFSDRYGDAPVKPLRFDDVPERLRHRLWTPVYEVLSAFGTFEVMWGIPHRQHERRWLDRLWTDIFRRPAGTRGLHEPDPDYWRAWFYHHATWVEVYDLIDFMVATSLSPESPIRKDIHYQSPLFLLDSSADTFNTILQAELAPWRFINGELVPISGEGDAEAVETALRTAPQLVAEHIRTALHNLNHRPEPNIRGAIAECTHAFESMAKHVLGTPKGTYSSLAQSLEKKGVHPLFVRAFKDLYNRESDQGGTRHGFKPGEDPTKHLAEGRMYVVMTSAFVSYMLEFYAPEGESQ